MAIEFGLPAETRERYDLPETVSFDFGKLMLSEAILLEDTFGIDVDELLKRLWPDDKTASRDLRAWGFVIWLAARRAGATVAYEDFDLDLYALRMAASSEAPDPKASEPAAGPSTPESLNVDGSVPLPI